MFEMLSNEIVDSSRDAYLVDYQGEGEMLAVCFGFFDNVGANKFDFYKRLKKLEAVSGKKIGKLLLRDFSNSWYLNGIAPLGGDVDASVAAIREIIAQVRPSQIITIGQSMGGYAAILYGALLGVNKVISFGPLSCFEAEKLEVMRDRRWLDVAKRVGADRYNDLPELLRGLKGKTEVEIFYGTHPGAGSDRSEAVNYDAGHGLAFYGINGVRLFPVHSSPHAIVEYLRVNKIIDDVLLNRLFGTEPGIRDVGVSAEWAKWLGENIALGCSDEQLVATLQQNGFAAEAAAKALASVQAGIELGKIVE